MGRFKEWKGRMTGLRPVYPINNSPPFRAEGASNVAGAPIYPNAARTGHKGVTAHVLTHGPELVVLEVVGDTAVTGEAIVVDYQGFEDDPDFVVDDPNPVDQGLYYEDRFSTGVTTGDTPAQVATKIAAAAAAETRVTVTVVNSTFIHIVPKPTTAPNALKAVYVHVPAGETREAGHSTESLEPRHHSHFPPNDRDNPLHKRA